MPIQPQWYCATVAADFLKMRPSTQIHCNRQLQKKSKGKITLKEQKGVVLIVALILLVVVSLLAMTSLRKAATTENITGNVRTTELANQAAEIALRHCESSAVKIAKLNANASDTTAEATYSSTFDKTKIAAAGTNQWQNKTTWDSAGTAVFVLPTTLMGGTSTYKRPPECMIELLSSGTGSTVVVPASFVITARGFGPEVAAGTGRPQGTEVWLQSTIEVQ